MLAFHANQIIGQFLPPDVKFETITRTYSPECLLDVFVISFIHKIEMDHLLPGVNPTRKYAEVAFVVIVGIESSKVSHQHIHWDQANLLVQLGLINPEGLPLTGTGAVAKLRNPGLPDSFYNQS